MEAYFRSGVSVLLRLAWVVTKLAYRGPRLLAVVCHVCWFDQGLPCFMAFLWDGAHQFLPEFDGVIYEGIVFVFLSVLFDQFGGLRCQAWGVVPSTPINELRYLNVFVDSRLYLLHLALQYHLFLNVAGISSSCGWHILCFLASKTPKGTESRAV